MEHEQHQDHGKTPAAGERVRDPVCGMMVDPATAISAGHGGKTYHFCCEGCRTRFVTAPERYLAQKPFELPRSAPAARPPHSDLLPPGEKGQQHPAGAHHRDHDHHGHGAAAHPAAARPPSPKRGEGMPTAGITYT